MFPPWAHVEPVSPPTYLCGKNKVTHSVLLQEPSIGAFTKMRRNRLAPRCRWVRHNISSAAMTLGPRRASCEFSGSRRRGSPGLSPRPLPGGWTSCAALGLAGVTSGSACKITAPANQILRREAGGTRPLVTAKPDSRSHCCPTVLPSAIPAWPVEHTLSPSPGLWAMWLVGRCHPHLSSAGCHGPAVSPKEASRRRPGRRTSGLPHGPPGALSISGFLLPIVWGRLLC